MSGTKEEFDTALRRLQNHVARLEAPPSTTEEFAVVMLLAQSARSVSHAAERYAELLRDTLLD